MVFLQTPSILFAYPEVSKCGVSSTCAESQKARTLLNAFFTYFCSALKSFTHLKSVKSRGLCSPVHSYTFLGTLPSFLHEITSDFGRVVYLHKTFILN